MNLKARYEGELKIGERVLPVAVLDNGQRIITQSAIFDAFGRPKRGSRDQGSEDNAKLPGLIDAQNLKPFITSELGHMIKPVKYKNMNGTTTTGYDAIILPLICDVYIEARNAKKDDGKPILSSKQLPNAMAAELLMRSLSKVGIIALVDEATGYQYERERKDELQKILQFYISEELLPWQKRFPDIFYKEIFRLNGWDYTVSDIKSVHQ